MQRQGSRTNLPYPPKRQPMLRLSIHLREPHPSLRCSEPCRALPPLKAYPEPTRPNEACCARLRLVFFPYSSFSSQRLLHARVLSSLHPIAALLCTMETNGKDGALQLHGLRERPRSLESDDAALSRLGKKPVLKVSSSATSISCQQAN